MDISAFEEILSSNDLGGELIMESGCSVVKGLLIIQKYLPDHGIESAEHDIIYSASASLLVEAGITAKDAILLRKYNWMIEDGFLACFV